MSSISILWFGTTACILVSAAAECETAQTLQGHAGQETEATDGADSCVLLQQPRRSIELRRDQPGCREILPSLGQHASELLQICQESLPAATCESAMDALGPQPWSENKVAQVCSSIGEDQLYRQGEIESQVVSLLSRAASVTARTDGSMLDQVMLSKDDAADQPKVPQKPQMNATSMGNSTNMSANISAVNATTNKTTAKANVSSAAGKSPDTQGTNGNKPAVKGTDAKAVAGQAVDASAATKKDAGKAAADAKVAAAKADAADAKKSAAQDSVKGHSKVAGTDTSGAQFPAATPAPPATGTTIASPSAPATATAATAASR